MLSFIWFLCAGEAKAQMILNPSASGIEIKIEPASTLTSSYTLNFSGLDFPNSDKADLFFRILNNNIVKCSDLNFEAKTIRITLNITCSDTTAWTVATWNAYFEERNSTHLAYYNSIL